MLFTIFIKENSKFYPKEDDVGKALRNRYLFSSQYSFVFFVMKNQGCGLLENKIWRITFLGFGICDF